MYEITFPVQATIGMKQSGNNGQTHRNFVYCMDAVTLYGRVGH